MLQEQSHKLRKNVVLKGLLFFFVMLVASIIEVRAQEKTSNVAILIDRSSSVEPANRDEAIRLVGGLVSGEMPSGLSEKWHFLPSEDTEDDPELLAVRERMAADLSRRLGEGTSAPLLNPNYELLVGSLGDRVRVEELSRGRWFKPEQGFFEEVVEAAALSTKGDPRTYFKLARATLGNRLDGNRNEFLLFVVSDGVEDLVNKSVAYYLDESKLKDPRALAKGDFRDDKTRQELELLNAGNYTEADRKVLHDFETKFAELSLGRFSLTGTQLESFFGRQGEAT